MTPQDAAALLILNLKRDEGLRLKPYKDSVGKLTIGYGRNLDDVGISQQEAETMLLADINVALGETRDNFPWIKDLPPKVVLGLINMVFNMGIPRVKGFAKMLDALEKHDFERAADEAMNSKWAFQVGPRAERIAKLFREAASE